MTAAEVAQAHSRLYTVCSQLYLHGLQRKLLPVVQALPDLAALLPSPFDTDQVAATHQALFSFNLFPYESVFLDATGLLGSAVSEAVAAVYGEVGYVSTKSSGAPDHLGEELGMLAFLCGAEADAWADDKMVLARQLQHVQRRFLQNHLLRWLVPVTVAIRHHAEPFFTGLAELTLDLVSEQYTMLLQPSFTPDPTFALPPAPALLQNEKTTLKDIADYLTTPPYSGLFLTRHSISRIGRAYRLPRGFGSRTQMVTNLLRSAAQYDALPALLSELSTLMEKCADDYRAVKVSLPAVTPFITPWQARIEETVVLLGHLQTQAADLMIATEQ